jgi:uncharacterized protein (DUF4213/DUF364 family)
MKILEQLIATLDFDAPVRKIRQGVFDTAVQTRNCGIAATLPREALQQHPPLVKSPGSLTEMNARQLAGLACSESILEAAIGMATINSLLDIDPTRCRELNAADLIARKARDKQVVIVGHFPFIPRIQKTAAALTVIERNPQPGDATEAEAAERLSDADVVAITGTALTNHTLEGLIARCKSDAFVMVLGPSAPLTPLLFDFGVDAVSGTRVVDPETAMRCVSQGANYRQIKGIERLTMLKNED